MRGLVPRIRESFLLRVFTRGILLVAMLMLLSDAIIYFRESAAVNSSAESRESNYGSDEAGCTRRGRVS